VITLVFLLIAAFTLLFHKEVTPNAVSGFRKTIPIQDVRTFRVSCEPESDPLGLMVTILAVGTHDSVKVWSTSDERIPVRITPFATDITRLTNLVKQQGIPIENTVDQKCGTVAPLLNEKGRLQYQALMMFR
jgi:hypothetical protein